MTQFIIYTCIAILYFLSGVCASASFHQTKEDRDTGALNAAISFALFVIACILVRAWA